MKAQLKTLEQQSAEREAKYRADRAQHDEAEQAQKLLIADMLQRLRRGH